MSGPTATVFVPATIGNVGPGFDVLGLAVDGLGDIIQVELTSDKSAIASITGRDAEAIPTNPEDNCASVAALSMLRRMNDPRHVIVRLERRLPMSGGLGSSAASSVGGAYAAAIASGNPLDTNMILAAALDGEARVAGRHLDNIAPAFFGGLTVVLGTDPPIVSRAPIQGDWWISLVSPAMRLATKTARAVLPETVERSVFIRQMGYVAGLVTAFANGDPQMMRQSLIDLYAEPLRSPLIKNFVDVKAAALRCGAIGCSISGAGPTVFAISDRETTAKAVATAMASAFAPMASTVHVGQVSLQGARVL